MTKHRPFKSFAALSRFRRPDDYIAFFDANSIALSEAAKRGFESHGRGFILMRAVRPCFVTISYATVDEDDEWLTSGMAREIAGYNPESQLLLGVSEPSGELWLQASKLVRASSD